MKKIMNHRSRRNIVSLAAAGVLLAVPFAVYLPVATYARYAPRLGGFPFFYWWQLLWLPLTGIAIGGAYAIVKGHR
jgi:hypothetical protein